MSFVATSATGALVKMCKERKGVPGSDTHAIKNLQNRVCRLPGLAESAENQHQISLQPLSHLRS
jgi:hypothetical protein